VNTPSKFDPTVAAATAIELTIRGGLFLASGKTLMKMENEIQKQQKRTE
jgi:hypothetical protein